jgi:hypothetical protein
MSLRRFIQFSKKGGFHTGPACGIAAPYGLKGFKLNEAVVQIPGEVVKLRVIFQAERRDPYDHWAQPVSAALGP